MRKLLLAIAIPFQGLVDQPSPTHGFINQQALAILKADGRRAAADWLGWYLAQFNAGCNWTDTGWRNIGHMYDPEVGRGLRGWPHALQMVREYWDLAARFHHQLEMDQAAFYLGAAAHLVQDLCVPHHAAARVFAGHQRFEEYARRYRHRFATHQGGLYDQARTPEGWVLRNADYTRTQYADCLTSHLEKVIIHQAVADLLPRAQRTTAGFVAFFLGAMGVS